MREIPLILRCGVVALVAALAPSVTSAQGPAPVEEVVPPPPPDVAPPPPPAPAPPPLAPAPMPPRPMPPPVVQPIRAYTVPPNTPLAPVTFAEPLPAAVPFMLGSGLSVLGGFALTVTSVYLAQTDLSGIGGDGVTAIAFTYIFGAVFAFGGLYLAIGGLSGDVELASEQPGWAWAAAIASLLGGISTVSAVVTALVDDEFGVDSALLAIAGTTFYLATLLVLIGLNSEGSTSVAVGPVPFEGGGGVGIVGRM